MNKKPLEIFFIDNAASADVFSNLAGDLNKEVWKFGTPEPTYGWEVEDPKSFWWCDLIKNRWHEVLFQHLIDRLEVVEPRVKNYVFKLINAQGIGKTFGLDGSIHTDHNFEFNEDGDGFMTFCYFPNQEWEAEWGGELQFFDEHGNIIASYYPMPNTCVVFDSNLTHRGLAPSRDCTKLRKAITLKAQVSKFWDTDRSVVFKSVDQNDTNPETPAD